MKEIKYKPVGFFIILLLFSLILRLIRLNMGLWLDELFTLTEFIRGSWKEIFTFYSAPNNHILYSFLAKICVMLFGEKEWSLRLPSVIIGTFTPPIFYFIFRDRLTEDNSLALGGFLAVSFWMVWFAQDARGYAGMILFSGLSQIFYLKILKDQQKHFVILYLVSSAIAIWFHLYSAFIIIGQILLGFGKWLLYLRNKPMIFILPGVSLILGLCLYSMVFDQLFTYALRGGREIEGRWLGFYFWKELIKMFSGTQFLSFGIFLLVLFSLGIFVLIKTSPQLCFLYLFPAGLIILMTFSLKVFIFPRFLSFFIPFFFIGIVKGIEFINTEARDLFPKLKPKIIYKIFVGIIYIFLLLGLGRYYQMGKQGFKEAAIYINRRYPEKEVISFGVSDYEYLFYDRYAEPWPGANPLLEEDLIGRLVVASYPWSWAPENAKLIREKCSLEKTWDSAGSEQDRVYLFRCF